MKLVKTLIEKLSLLTKYTHLTQADFGLAALIRTELRMDKSLKILIKNS